MQLFWALSSAGSERLPYKQRVGGSNPSAPTETMEGSLAQLNRAFDYGSKGCGFESRRSHHFMKVRQPGRYQSGQMGQTVNLLVFTFGGSNPSPPTQQFCGNSSVGRARPCQGRGREFESRLPLHTVR